VSAFTCDGSGCNTPDIIDAESGTPSIGPPTAVRRGCALRRHGGIPDYDQPDLIMEAHKMKWLVDGALDDVPGMAADFKRHIVYYFVSTNVYCVNGRGRRLDMPLCYKTSIRAKYPNRLGVAYSDASTDPQ
jgi:hypothetical protein